MRLVVGLVMVPIPVCGSRSAFECSMIAVSGEVIQDRMTDDVSESEKTGPAGVWVTVGDRLALPSPSYTMCVEQEWVGTGAVARGFGLGASPA